MLLRRRFLESALRLVHWRDEAPWEADSSRVALPREHDPGLLAGSMSREEIIADYPDLEPAWESAFQAAFDTHRDRTQPVERA